MEKVRAVNTFERSIEKSGLRYMDFYGDDDSKRFSAVEKDYGEDKPAIKKECIGHYQGGRESATKNTKREEALLRYFTSSKHWNP